MNRVAICVAERVPIVSFFWGDPTPYVNRVHAGGGKVFHQAGSVADAQRAAKANVDVIIAQGVEAGGHIAGEVSTLALVPRVVDAVAPHIVAAAGGIADGRGVVAALALGAQAAVLGTRFLASTESRAHPDYKKKLLAVNENDTVRTTLFGFGWPNASHRTLRTPFVRAMDWSRSARPRIARGRTGDRSYRHRLATHAAPAFHGIPAEHRCNW
jgi:NAD(P)H-dependent flavin oxidoreductase YrpB (nitropropane dioxygenase family)